MTTFAPKQVFCLFLLSKHCIEMAKIDLTAKEVASLKLHYQKEQLRLTAALDHVETMLAKLGAPSTSPAESSKAKALTAKGVPAKKRGPKSIWGTFIQKRLRARNRPMSYDELIADAMSIHKIPEARLKSAKASILNSAFRLRTVHGKITTVGRAGKKDKMVVLTKWLQPDGQLKPEYGKAFKSVMGGKAQRVDMDSIPVSAYPED